MKFSEIIDGLQKGHSYKRQKEDWRNKFIVCHISQLVPADEVPKMNSIPPGVKRLLEERSISFHDQVLLFVWDNKRDGNYLATGYIPTWEDIFADDWVLA